MSTYTTTPQQFKSFSGISADASVIVTIHRLTRPEGVTIIGQVYSEPFAFHRETLQHAIKRALDCLYDRHPSMFDQINEAFAGAIAEASK